MSSLIEQWQEAIYRHNRYQKGRQLQNRDRVVINWEHGWWSKPICWLQPQGTWDDAGPKRKPWFIADPMLPFDVYHGWGHTWRVDPVGQTMCLNSRWALCSHNSWHWRWFTEPDVIGKYHYANRYSWGYWYIKDTKTGVCLLPEPGMMVEKGRLVPGSAPDAARIEQAIPDLDALYKNIKRKLRDTFMHYEQLAEGVPEDHPLHQRNLYTALGYRQWNEIDEKVLRWMLKGKGYNLRAHQWYLLAQRQKYYERVTLRRVIYDRFHQQYNH